MIKAKNAIYTTFVALALVPALASAAPLLGPDLSSFSILAGTDVSLGARSQYDGLVGSAIAIAGSGGTPTAGVYSVTTLHTATSPTGTPLTTATLLANGVRDATPAIVNGLQQLRDAKATLSAMTANAGAPTGAVSTTADTSTTFASGLYAQTIALGARTNSTFVSGLYATVGAMTVGADATITLDGQNQTNPTWIFNIGTDLGTGPSLRFVFANVVGSTASVLWNARAIGLGAGTDFVGTMLAGGAISEAAGVTVSCGNAWSLAAVGTNADSRVQSSHCMGSATWAAEVAAVAATGGGVTPVPEPETSALLLAGLGMLALKARRSSSKKSQHQS